MHCRFRLLRLSLAVMTAATITAQPGAAQIFSKKNQDLLNGLSKKVVEPAMGCGYLGAALGSLTRDRDVTKWAGIGSAALCTAISLDMDRQRREAIKKEEALDKAIAEQRLSNEELVARNEALHARLNELQLKAASLEAERRANPEQALRIAAEIQAEKDAAKESIGFVDSSITSVEARLNRGDLSPEEASNFTQMRENLLKRRAYYEAIADIKAE